MKTLKQLKEALDDGSYLQNYTQKTEVGKTFVQIHKEANATRAKLEKDRLESNTASVSTKEIDRSAKRMGYNPGEDLTKGFPKMAGPDDYRLPNSPTPADAYRLQDEETVNETAPPSHLDWLKSQADTHFARSTDHLVKASNATDFDVKHFHDRAADHHKALHDLYNGAHKKCCGMAESTTPGHEGTTSEEVEEDKPLMSFLEHREVLNEMTVGRKHFQSVAATVCAIEDPKKRQMFADHHAAIFSKANPHFSHEKFHEACGTAYRVAKPSTPAALKEATEYKERMQAYQKDSKFLVKPHGDNFAMVGHDTGYIYNVDKNKNRIKNSTEDHNVLKNPPVSKMKIDKNMKPEKPKVGSAAHLKVGKAQL